LFALLLFNHPNQVVKSYTKGCVYKDSVDIEPTYGDKFFTHAGIGYFQIHAWVGMSKWKFFQTVGIDFSYNQESLTIIMTSML